MILNILDRGRAILSARPSADILALTRLLEGRRKWLKSGGVSIEPTPHNLKILSGSISGLEIVGDRRCIAPRTTVEARRERSKRKPYKPATIPFPHQRKALKRMRGRAAFALFAEPGTGKSKVAIDWAGGLWSDGSIDMVVVIAPKGVHRQWAESQIPIHCGARLLAAYWDGTARRFVATGKAPKKRHIEFIAINYEAAITETGKAALLAQLEGVDFALVLDESHKVKNHNSRRWAMADEIASMEGCRARLLLTGTPIAKNLVDEWSQLKIIDRSIIGIEYVTAFRNEYCITTGEHGSIVIGTRNLDKFKELTQPYVFRARKEELGIAPKTYDDWVFSMDKKQARVYRDMARDLVAEIEDGEVTTAINAIVKINRLQQISNGFVVKDDPEGNPLPAEPLFKNPAKNPRVIALLEAIESHDEAIPTIIWCRYRFDVETLLAAIPEPMRVAYYGGTKEKDKRAALASFLDPDGPPYFIATTGSAGTGLDGLQTRCSRAIYYSNSENSIDRWQSEDRIHRVGTTQPVNIIDLVATGSRDRAILANLRSKKNLSDLTLDDIKREIADALQD